MLAGVLVGAVLFWAVMYRVVGGFLVRRLQVDAQRETPARAMQDGVDYVPTHPVILFGHHFSSIAGAGPIVGPIFAGLAFGWLPAFLWILIGAALVGGVHDFCALMASVRHRGETIGQVCRRYLDPKAYHMLLAFIWLAMIYVLVAFLDLTASSFAPPAAGMVKQGGAVATASMVYIGLAVVFGLLVYLARVRLWVASLVFVPLVFGAVALGTWWPLTAEQMPALLGSAKNTWSLILLGYCFVASVLPVWLLLQPRDYLSAYLLVACLVGGALGLVVGGLTGHVEVQYPAFIGWQDAQLGWLFPALFITIACGAISGFHSIVASGTTSKQLARETDARPVSYGAMLVEGVLAVVALSAVMILSSKPAGQTPVAVFANGMGTFLSVFGIPAPVASTFGLLAVSTFLLTTLDTCTRLGRFIFQEFFGLTGLAGRLGATVATLAIPGVLVFVQVTGPDGKAIPAYQMIWPAFGATNQLLGALALMVVLLWLVQTRQRAGFVVLPMLFMFASTLTALALLAYRHLTTPSGNLYVGVVSLLMGLLAVGLIGNAVWRLVNHRAQAETGMAAISEKA